MKKSAPIHNRNRTAVDFEHELICEALRQAVDPAFIVSRKGRVVFGNGAYKKLARQFLHNKFKYALGGTSFQRATLTKRAKNGRVFRIDETISPIHIQGALYFFIAWKDVTQEYRNLEKISRQAFYDSLTGLPNRPLLAERMESAMAAARRSKLRVAALFIDMDKFKPVNDNYGHAAGDEVLKIIASRLRASVRKVDTVARLGGDEFIVLLSSIKTIANVRRVAAAILKRLERPYKVDAHSFKLSASIGVALFPDHAQSVHNLLHAADMAMKNVEQRGGDNYHILAIH